jgi:hypothetical protein
MKLYYDMRDNMVTIVDHEGTDHQCEECKFNTIRWEAISDARAAESKDILNQVLIISHVESQNGRYMEACGYGKAPKGGWPIHEVIAVAVDHINRKRHEIMEDRHKAARSN